VPAVRRKAKRGRPLKFGRRGRVVALTLPQEVIAGLRKVDPDIAWAIVRLFEQSADAPNRERTSHADAELVEVEGQHSLIVVNSQLFHQLPGVNIIPLHDDRAFLALEPGHGIADLELAVVDRLARKSVPLRERRALAGLRGFLRKCRTDRRLRPSTRAIIVLERAPRDHP
jgi:hypothetical protein